jgi:glycosyltransferase involved in cell wall biosynthesis
VALNLLGLPSTRQGGAGFYASLLARELAARESGDLTVLCGPEVASELDDLTGAARVVALAPRHRSPHRTALDLVAAARRPDAFQGPYATAPPEALRDVELVHYPLSFMTAPAHAARSVVTAVDLQHVDRPEGFRRRDRVLRALRWHRALRAADRVIAISGFTRDSVVEHLGLDRARVDVVYPGCHPAFFEHDSDRGNAPAGDFLFYPASPLPAKNHALLIRAFARIAERHAGLRLVLCGPRLHDWSSVRAEVASAGLGHRVEIVGHLSLDDLRAHYAHARAMVFPSLYEGFGIPLVEAMAAGCPVVAARAASIPEVLGEAGSLFDPQDEEEMAAAVERCLEGPRASREQAIEAGRLRAQRFTVERMTDDTLRTYERATG